MGSGERRKALFEIDARWNIRIGIRMVMNLLCILSIVMAVMTIKKTNTTEFRPKPFRQANTVLVYIPCDAITIVWNMINIILFVVRKKNVAHWLNTLAHFILGFGFAVVGIYVTIVAWSGYKGLKGDLYHKGSIVAANGTTIEVTAENINSCPAFADCQQQAYWIAGARDRSLISVIGCGLFDAVFLLHGAFFFWCMNDSVFGLRGRSQRRLDREERARIHQEALDNPIPKSADTEKSFDIGALPSRSISSKPSSDSLARMDIERPSDRQTIDRQASDIQSISRITSASTSDRIERSMPERSLSFETTRSMPMPERSLSVYEAKTVPMPERDSLSLSIFETTHSVPPMPRAPKRASRSATAPLAGYGLPRTSLIEEEPTLSYDRQLQQQQLQQMQQHLAHAHQPGCTCPQSRTSYAARNRQSLSTSTHRGSPLPQIPQPYKQTPRSSLRHSISPAEILESQPKIQSPQSQAKIQSQPRSQSQSRIQSPSPSQSQPQSRSQSRSQSPHQPQSRQSYQLPSRQSYQSRPSQLQSHQSQSQPHQQSRQSYQQSRQSYQSQTSLSQSHSSQEQIEPNFFDSLSQSPPKMQLHQALPDILSPEEKDVTALPAPPPQAQVGPKRNTLRKAPRIDV